MGDGADHHRGDVPAQRENFRKLLSLAAGPAPQNISVEDRTLQTTGGLLPLRLYRRDDLLGLSLPTCVFFHGGGFIAGSIDTHDAICRVIADESGWQLISVGYRLAPEHPYPAQIEDGVAVLDALDKAPEDFGAMRGNVAVAGDSVGAGLAALLAQFWHAEGRQPLTLQILLFPALEPKPRFPSREKLARGYYIEDHMIAADFAAYRGAFAAVPTVFDTGNFSGLPPAIVHVAEYDPFHDEGIAYAAALEAADISVQVIEHPGMVHLFHAFPRFIPGGVDALRQVGKAMKDFAGAAAAVSAR